MKRLLTVLLAVFSLACTAAGQKKAFSLELGASQGPLHMALTSYSDVRRELADQGRRMDAVSGIHPSLTLSGVFRTGYRWEVAATACVCWSIRRIYQYETFGIDPYGNPRYDLRKETPAGWKALAPGVSLTLQGRVFWNPEWKVQWYSAFGLGVAPGGILDTPALLPSLVPVGFRLGGGRLYFFAETGLTPFASLLHAGLGWRP